VRKIIVLGLVLVLIGSLPSVAFAKTDSRADSANPYQVILDIIRSDPVLPSKNFYNILRSIEYYRQSHPVYIPYPPGTPTLRQKLSNTSTSYRSSIEEVRLHKVFDYEDKAVIERPNGEVYLIEYGVGVLPIWMYEGKKVLIYSPGTFLVGSRIILPNRDNSARIWSAQLLYR